MASFVDLMGLLASESEADAAAPLVGGLPLGLTSSSLICRRGMQQGGSRSGMRSD